MFAQERLHLYYHEYLKYEYLVVTYFVGTITLVVSLPQLLQGTLVNFGLAFLTLKYDTRKSLPLVIFPSIIVTAVGMLFGSTTASLPLIIPAIIFGNWTYCQLINQYKSYSNGSFLIVAPIIKTFIIGIYTLTLYKFGFVSQLLIVPMTIIQIITASIGLISVLIIWKHIKS